jgi:hypothetical protein
MLLEAFAIEDKQSERRQSDGAKHDVSISRRHLPDRSNQLICILVCPGRVCLLWPMAKSKARSQTTEQPSRFAIRPAHKAIT